MERIPLHDKPHATSVLPWPAERAADGARLAKVAAVWSTDIRLPLITSGHGLIGAFAQMSEALRTRARTP